MAGVKIAVLRIAGMIAATPLVKRALLRLFPVETLNELDIATNFVKMPRARAQKPSSWPILMFSETTTGKSLKA